jgi:aminoglycoside 6'-N-acetyltransferase
MTIGFRPLGEADLATLRNWIARPHWQEWWGEPDEQVEEIRASLRTPGFAAFVFTFDSRDAGYIQSWQPDGTWEIPIDAPPGTTRGIDLSIAEAADLGHGLGRRVIAAFVERLAGDGIRRVLIDPHPDNARARRAYAAAGFVPAVEGVREDGPYVLMVRDLHEKFEP